MKQSLPIKILFGFLSIKNSRKGRTEGCEFVNINNLCEKVSCMYA